MTDLYVKTTSYKILIVQLSCLVAPIPVIWLSFLFVLVQRAQIRTSESVKTPSSDPTMQTTMTIVLGLSDDVSSSVACATNWLVGRGLVSCIELRFGKFCVCDVKRRCGRYLLLRSPIVDSSWIVFTVGRAAALLCCLSKWDFLLSLRGGVLSFIITTSPLSIRDGGSVVTDSSI